MMEGAETYMRTDDVRERDEGRRRRDDKRERTGPWRSLARVFDVSPPWIKMENRFCGVFAFLLSQMALFSLLALIPLKKKKKNLFLVQ